MKRWLIASLLLIPIAAVAVDKFLHYKFNDAVIISISNIACPFKEINEEYPLAVIANRIDGERLMGCFKNDKDDIVIQWVHGDTTRLPANVFLTKPTL